MMSKKYARFLSALFCGFLALLFAANALTPDKAMSENENRVLAQKPKITANTFRLPPLSGLFSSDQGGDFFTGKLMENYETYVIDQFVLRDGWVAAKAFSEKLVGKSENNGVYFCDDSTLISRFDEPDANRLERNLNNVVKFMNNDKVTVPVYFGLIPTQARIWADKLPAGAPNADQGQIMAQAAQTVGENFIDLTQALESHKDEAIFYRTDHHWTSLGAYYGYRGLSQALGYDPIPLTDYTKTTVSTEFYGTTFSNSGVRWVKPDEMDIYVPADGIEVTSTFSGTPEEGTLYAWEKLEIKDKYTFFMGGNQSLGVVKTGNTDKPKLLIIRDSYTDSLVPFLTPHYSEIHLVDLRYYKQSIAGYIQNNGIDAALILYSVPNFVGESNLGFLNVG